MEYNTSPQPDTVKQYAHHIPRWLYLVLGVLIIAFILVMLLERHTKHMTPGETLLLLEQSSDPVTTTPEERKEEVQTLQKSGTTVHTSDEERLRTLESL